MDESTTSTAPIQKSHSGRRLVRSLSDVLPVLSIAASHRVANQEPGCHQGNAEHLDDATHVSSVQVRVAH